MKTIKIKDYYGIYQEIPVDDNLYAEWKAMQAEENRRHKREVYHTAAMDPIDMEAMPDSDQPDALFEDMVRKDEIRLLYESIAKLTPIQRRRIQMLLDDMTYSDIARIEKRDVSVIYRSIEKSLKNLRRMMSE